VLCIVRESVTYKVNIMKDFLNKKGIIIDSEILSSDGRKYYLSELLKDYVSDLKNSYWNNIKEKLPKQLEQCVFKLNDGSFCIGKCNYFEHGDSELIEMRGKSLSNIKSTYRNWELHNFDNTKNFEVTHWCYLNY